MEQMTLILLKPDCLERNLDQVIIQKIQQMLDGSIVVQKRLRVVNEEKIFAHCEKLITLKGEHVKQYLRDLYLNKEILILLMKGENIIDRMRRIIGNSDPSQADPRTIRGMYGNDSFAKAEKENRMVRNLIHASDSAEEVAREMKIWL